MPTSSSSSPAANKSNQLGFTHRYIPSLDTGDRVGLTLLLLHGTGGNEDDLLPLGRELDPNAGLLSPRGKILEGGRIPRFFRRLAEGVFDIEDLKFRTYELAGFVEKASEMYGFDVHKVIAVGYSNGANIAASMLLLKPQTLSYAEEEATILDQRQRLSLSFYQFLTKGQAIIMIILTQHNQFFQAFFQ